MLFLKKAFLRARLWLVLSLCLLALASFLLPAPYPDPVYGRPLSHWLTKLYPSSDPGEQSAAREAILAIGDKAVPQLLFWIGAEESRFSKVALKIESYLGIDLPITPIEVRRDRAIAAFQILGSKADEAIPGLTLLTRNKKFAPSATRALTYLGAEALNSLLISMGCESSEARAIAALDIGYRAIPDGRSVHALVNALQDENGEVRSTAAHALARFEESAELVVPALVLALSDQDQSVRRMAISSLGALGEQAEAALPHLLKLQEHPDLIMLLRGAVTRISPQIAEKHGLLSRSRLASFE